jgi:hypothetical protein
MLLINCKLYDTEDVVKNLKQGLFSTYKNYIRQSLKGLYYWTAYAQENELSQPPKKLFEKLTDLICSLREPGLDDALHYTYLIVKKFSDSFQKKDFELLYEGLEYLLKETQYPKNWFDLDLKYSLSVISNIDKPTYREYSSKLAHQLYQLLAPENNEIPDVLEKWKEQSLNDRMPQIRKIWEQ